MQADQKSHVQAAVALARTLRGRGLVAAESAGTDGVARVLVFSRTSAQLAEQIHVVPQDGKLWFWWSNQPLWPADDIGTAADTIMDVVMSEGDSRVTQTRWLADA